MRQESTRQVFWLVRSSTREATSTSSWSWNIKDTRDRAIGEILRRTDLPVEPLVIRPGALAQRLREGHPLLRRVMSEAIPLYPEEADPRIES